MGESHLFHPPCELPPPSPTPSAPDAHVELAPAIDDLDPFWGTNCTFCGLRIAWPEVQTDEAHLCSWIVGRLEGHLCMDCTNGATDPSHLAWRIIQGWLIPTRYERGKCAHLVLDGYLTPGVGPHEVECVECEPELRYHSSYGYGHATVYCARVGCWAEGYIPPALRTPDHESD